jgi:hypothetical protein
MVNAKPATIGHPSLLTGCRVETIRYNQRIGLLPIAERSGALSLEPAAGCAAGSPTGRSGGLPDRPPRAKRRSARSAQNPPFLRG